MRKFLIATVLIAGLGLSACNTVEGVGKDVESAGEATAKAADKAK